MCLRVFKWVRDLPHVKNKNYFWDYKLSVDFFSKYMLNDELGSKRVEISSRDNFCISDSPYTEDKEEVYELFQDTQICTSMSTV